MNSNFKTPILSLSAALILGMSGCSISSDDETVVEKSTAIAEVSTIDGVAVDGYLKYSTVCLDLNSDSFCQPTEPFTLTDSDGSFSLSLTKAQKNNAGYASAQLVVYGGQDSDRPGEDFIGKLKAPNDGTGSVNVTPVTTLVSAYIQKAGVADVSVEDITAAKTKVASALGITQDQVSADPRADGGDAELMNATLQLQYAVSTMVQAANSSDATATDADVAGDIFAAFATGLDNAGVSTDVAAGVAAIIAHADETKLKAIDTNLVNVKEVAKAAATNVNTAMTATGFDVTNADSLNDALTQVVVYQEMVTKAIETIDFTAPVAATEFNYSSSNINFAEESAKIYLEDLGVDTTDLNMTEYATKVSFDQDLDALALSLATDSAVLAKIQTKITDIQADVTKIQSDVADAAATADGASKMAALEADVTALLTPTATADVADAKNLVTQIRESVTSFVDVDAVNVEDNTSTILGSQVSLITSKIEPAVESIASDFNVSASALDASLTAFGNSLETDFASVLGTSGDENTIGTIGSIEARLDAIDLAIGNKAYNEDWSVTAGTDSIAHTYVLDSTTNIATETFTFNDGTVTTTYVDNAEPNVEDEENGPSSISTSGTIEFAGTGYDLSVSKLSFVDSKAELIATGSITGLDNSSMTLTALNISFDMDDTKMDTAHMFNNIEGTFDGTIVAGGRTVTGKLVVSESDGSKNQIIGTYTGTSTEPSFEGIITANLSLDDFKTVGEDSDGNWGIRPDSLLMVTYADTTKSFVMSTITTQLATTETSTYYETVLNTQDGKSLTCSPVVTYQKDSSGYKIGETRNITCTGGTVDTYMGDNKVITLTVNAKEYKVGASWTNAYSSTVDGKQVNSSYMNSIELTDAYIWADNDVLYADFDGDNQGQVAVTITDISMRDAVTMDEMDMDLTFTGTLTHGAKVITATAGLRQAGTSVSSTMYAENISITDGTSYIKIAELSATAAKSGMFGDNGNNDGYNSNYGYSAFENYSVNYSDYWNDYYGYDDNGPEFSNVTVNDFNISITDADGKALTFDADVSYEKNAFGTETIAFNGTYEYDQTKFVGIVDIAMNDNAKTNSFSVSGDVESNGFEPLSIAAAGSMLGNELNAYGLFTRGEDYKLGLSIVGTYNETTYENNTTFNLADSNGVMSTIKDSYIDMHESYRSEDGLTCYMHVGDDHDSYVEMLCSEVNNDEGSSKEITLTDKDGTSLATMGEAATGNGWEITYSDDTTETIF